MGAVNGMPAWVDIPPLSDEQYNDIALAQRDALIDEATKEITVWQTKLLMSRKLKGKEMLSINEWMDYIDAIADIDLTTVPNID